MGLTQKLGLLAQSVQQDSSLNIGIGGAANASYKLQVTGNANFTNTVNGFNWIGTSNSTFALYYNNSSSFVGGLGTYSWQTGNSNYSDLALVTLNNFAIFTGNSITPSIYVNSSKNVGIGTISPAGKLEINGLTFINNTGDTTARLLLRNTTTGASSGGLDIQEIGVDASLNNASNGYLSLSTNNSERLRISSAGIITTPSQVSFKAYITGANPSLTKGALVTMPYNAEEYDVQSNFNTGTYKFTAPVAGKYLFIANVNMYGVDDAAAVRIFLTINSSTNRLLFWRQNMATGNTGDCNFSGSDILNLAAGNTVEVRIITDGSGTFSVSAGLDYNSFSGQLLG